MLSKFRHLPDSLAAFVEKRPLLCVIIVAAYILSPFDVLPEGLLGPLGLFDDALVGIAAVSLLKRAAKARIAKRKTAVAQIPQPPKQPERPAERRDDRRDERPRQDQGRRPDGEQRRPDRNQRWQDKRRGEHRPDNPRGERRP